MPVGLITAGIKVTAENYKRGYNILKKQVMANRNDYLTEQCGNRPFFTGKRRKEYDACVERANLTAPRSDVPGLPPGGTTPGNDFLEFPTGDTGNNGGGMTQQTKTLLYVGGAALLLGAAYLIFKKK